MQEWTVLKPEEVAIVESICHAHQDLWLGIDSEGCRACPIEPACTAYRRGILGREAYEFEAWQFACKIT